jgi:hypothetical protein
MKNRILAELDFASILNESKAQTATGADLLRKYQSFLITNESTHNLINAFVKEASVHTYDNGVNEALEIVSDYINMNKTIWALSSACENINNNNSSYNYINKNAAKQVENLLEMNEDEVVKYIKAGALKSVMFCEAFRNIAKQVYKDSPMVEEAADYTAVHPVSMVENVGDGFLFEVNGTLYKMDLDKNVQEADWKTASNTFKTVSSLLESDMCTVDENTITIEFNKSTYVISEAGKCEKCKAGNAKSIDGCGDCKPDAKDTKDPEAKKKVKESFTAEQLRENNRLVVMATAPRAKAQVAGVLEAIALLVENYSNITNLDNVSVYSTRNDKFVVIEAGSNLYATLLQSNRHPKWTINENAVDALSFIKTKTNVSLGDKYSELVSEHIEKVSEEEKDKIEQELKENERNSYRERIAQLTEKFKNDPTKLAVLSQLAAQLTDAE